MRVLLLLCALVAVLAKKRYDNYQVYQLEILTDSQIQFTRGLHHDDELDFWSDTDVMVPPHRVEGFLAVLRNNGITYTLLNDNVQADLDREEMQIEQRDRTRPYDLDNWNTYTQILDAVDDFVAACPDDVTCERVSMGQSYEGNDVPAITISSGSGNPVIYLDSLIHCREWLAGATVLRLADRLINGNDDEAVRMRTTYDWYIAPVINPDGYLYTWSNERMWRKNREPNDNSNCVGTDLNRNFAVEWMNAGTSSSPCSDTYGGPSAASAIETRNVQDKLMELGDSIHGAISYHSYARMWLHAYGYVDRLGRCATSDFHDEIYRVAELAALAVEEEGGQNWQYGPVCTVIYPASGSTVDFAHDQVGAIYSFTPELRGFSFAPDADQIEPSYREQWAGLVAMADAIADAKAH